MAGIYKAADGIGGHPHLTMTQANRAFSYGWAYHPKAWVGAEKDFNKHREVISRSFLSDEVKNYDDSLAHASG